MAFATGEARWGPVADRYAQQYGVDPRLFRALVTQESGWNPNARSGAGAVGLTQVVPRWHPNADLSTPESQLRYGAQHIGSLLRKYGNPRDALAVYNSGRPWATSQSFGETRAYVQRILGRYGQGTGTTTATPSPTAPTSLSAPSAQPSAQPVVDPTLTADIWRYANDSEKAVLSGAALPDVTPLVQRAAKRSAQAPLAAARQVATDATSLTGAPAFPGGDQQGIAPSGNEVVDAAAGQLGVPYSWGGGTPAGPGRGFGRGANTVGFDCSSLVQYAWAKAGVKLPRTTYDQIKVGRAVPNVGAARPGDLLFPHTGHVMLYVGNGQAIEAPRTGGHVQRVSVRGRRFIAIRRPA